MTMLEQFHAYINRYNLLTEGDKLILALSGGIDSMVLADLLLKSKVEFVSAHCNFHLRGEESDGDEKFVRDYAERNGIQCFVKHLKPRNMPQSKAFPLRWPPETCVMPGLSS